MSTLPFSGPRRARAGRYTAEVVAFALCGFALLLVVVPVFLIVLYILWKGASGISWEFLTQAPERNGREGGIFPAILGTLYLLVGTLIFAVPLGVLAAVYLTEYARPGRLVRLVNLSIVNLAGVPSIVYGLFGLGAFVFFLGFGASLLAASLTLACQALALIITASREALLAVPRVDREASLGLGATRWQTVRHVVLPQAVPGILTGVLLALGRAAGETAPILAVGVAFSLRDLPASPLDQFMALPYHLYISATQIPEMPEERTWAVALVLLTVVLLFNLAGVAIRLRFERRR